jgi:hypothetical protein
MPFRHGKATTFTIDSVSLSAFCTNVDLAIDVDMADTTTFGASWKTAVAGVPGGKMTLTGDYDPTITTGPAWKLAALVLAAAPVTAAYNPGGAAGASGDWTLTSVYVSNYSESAPVGGVATFKADLFVNAAPSRHV